MSFKTQFMIEFLLLFTGCRKVLRQNPDIYIYIYIYIIYIYYIILYDNQVVGIQHVFFIFQELIKMKKI